MLADFPCVLHCARWRANTLYFLPGAGREEGANNDHINEWHICLKHFLDSTTDKQQAGITDCRL